MPDMKKARPSRPLWFTGVIMGGAAFIAILFNSEFIQDLGYARNYRKYEAEMKEKYVQEFMARQREKEAAEAKDVPKELKAKSGCLEMAVTPGKIALYTVVISSVVTYVIYQNSGFMYKRHLEEEAKKEKMKAEYFAKKAAAQSQSTESAKQS